MSGTISIGQFVKQPNDNMDSTPYVRQALEELVRNGASRLVFPRGEYHFWPDLAYEQNWFISNHDQRIARRRCAFPLIGLDGVVIDGQGSEFIFHGMIVPFAIDGCRRITLMNLSVDWQRPFTTEGIIIASEDDFVDVLLPDTTEYRVEGGKLIIIGEGWEEPVHVLNQYDPARGRLAYDRGDIYLKRGFGNHAFEERGDGLVRLRGFTDRLPAAGHVLIMRHFRRSGPAVFIKSSSDITLDGVRLHHAGGMGVLAQRSANIQLMNCQVAPKPGSGRVTATMADATHFVHCLGNIRLDQCVFEHQMDDALNVHGIYARITDRPAAGKLLVKLMHHEQFGVELAAPGDTMEFVDRITLLSYGEAVVKAVKAINTEYTEIEFEDELPEKLRLDDVVGNITWSANVTVTGCAFRNNRARGLLLTTAGDVVIERNTFSTPGSAVKISGDANFWFESGAVRNVIIRDNEFIDCNYGPWGKAVIDIDPEIVRPDLSDGCYHRGIIITNNRFKAFEKAIVRAASVDGLEFRHNEITGSDTYPCRFQPSNAVHLSACRNTAIGENRYPDESYTELAEQS